MQAAVPVIVSRFGQLGRIVLQENCGLAVNTEDSRQLADAIEQLLADPHTADAMGRNGESAIKSRYNWEKESEKLLNFLAAGFWGRMGGNASAGTTINADCDS